MEYFWIGNGKRYVPLLDKVNSVEGVLEQDDVK